MKIKKRLLVIALLGSCTIFSQQYIPTDFGFKHLKLQYKNETVDVLVKSRKGDENKKKPLFFFIQGSGAKPLIKYNDKGHFLTPVEGLVEDKFHIVYVNKPGLPLIMHKDSLVRGQVKNRKTRLTPLKFRENNNLEYYVERNDFIINHLIRLPWVDKNRIVVAGHSEGSSIAAHLTYKNKEVTHLIYSGGTPYYPRILAMITQDRRIENDSVSMIEEDFNYWRDVVNYPKAIKRNKGWNTNKGTYSFSQNENEVLKGITIPVLITYGTKDEACPFNDMFKIETILEGIKHITFKDYRGLEHNYFKMKLNGTIDYSNYNWDKVVFDWLEWVSKSNSGIK